VFDNDVLRKIFGQKRVETMGGWRKLHKEELRDLYSSSNTIPVRNEMDWARSTYVG
jgi:hypothetical protein